jgi:diguanylate cyclase (GGDEF)-like protein/PAS domain S-box-containing protein
MLPVAMATTLDGKEQTVLRMGQLYAALSQINQAILRVATNDQLFEQICAALVEYGGFKMAWVGWNDPLTHTVSVASHYGDVDGYLQNIVVRSDDTPEGRGPAGTAIREDRLQVFNDFLGAPQTRPWHEAAKRCGFQAIGAFPIHFGGEVCGAILGYSTERDFFGPAEIELLVEAAADISFALDHLAGEAKRRQAEDALRQSESRLEEAQRIAHLGSWNWNVTTGAMSWTAELCRIHGLDARSHSPSFEDFIGRVHPDDRDRVQSLLGQAVVDRQARSFEFRIVRPDGEVRTIFNQSEVMADASGQVIGIAGACLDITNRKLDEQLERDRGRILELVAQNLPLTEILSGITAMLEERIQRSRCAILLVNDGRLSTTVAPRLPVAYLRALKGGQLGPSTSAVGATYHTRKTVICADIASDPLWHDYRELANRHGLRACWSVPIESKQEGVLGSLAIYLDRPCRPAPRELALLATIARLAAVAVEHRHLTDQLAHQAQHDGLTGLPNRLLFQDRLGQAIARARRSQRQVAVLYTDLDRFKHINDTLGHSAGDALLHQAAGRLEQCIRIGDTIARLGGDEFTLILPDLDDSAQATRIATKILETMREPFRVDGRELFTSISLGISLYPADGGDIEALMANADVAMYRAKDMGRDNFQWFASAMNARAKDRMDLESQLRRALASGELSLCYQPQYGPQGLIRGFEALMRWHHPVLGEISPSRFIPLAEDSGLIVPMGEWALREACMQTQAWRTAGHDVRIAVNVSAAQFKRADWVETVRVALRETRLAPDALELEITESLLMQGVSETSANLIELRNLGIGVAIDDFGTGYSSLSYLHTLPVTTLKIDQSFVREIGAASIPGQEDAPIIRTIIALARNFGMSVVAEGVENEAQRELLLRLGCDGLQGYLLQLPLTVTQANELLATCPAPTRSLA